MDSAPTNGYQEWTNNKVTKIFFNADYFLRNGKYVEDKENPTEVL
jgi:hypothetical protein